MTGHMSTLPLTRRLVSWYLVFGLAGLFLSLIISILLTYHGHVVDYVPLAAIIPLIVLAVGAVILWQSVRFHAEIEQQLLRFSSDPSNNKLHHTSRPANDPAAIGWNTLLEQLATQDSLAALEKRLSGSLASRRDHRPSIILQALSDGIALTEADGKILYANRSLAILVQCTSSDQLIGKSLLPILRVQDAHNSAAVLSALLATTANSVVELHRSSQLSDGVLRISRHLASDPESNSTRIVWAVRDVTQQALVDESRSSFVSMATHELRTPLANLKAYAETLAIHEGIDVEKQKEFCNIINAEATRLARFVDEMLNVSQIEAGSMVFDMREADLERILNSVIEHVRPQMDSKKISFEVKLPPKFPALRLDKDKFESALVNLLGNAAKYTPENGTVRFETQLRGQQIEFVVNDTGFGISKEEQTKIFDKFFRSSDARVREVDGNGLGLTFTQEVIQRHGGRLSLESELNQGSTFTISLPLPDSGAR